MPKSFPKPANTTRAIRYAGVKHIKHPVPENAYRNQRVAMAVSEVFDEAQNGLCYDEPTVICEDGVDVFPLEALSGLSEDSGPHIETAQPPKPRKARQSQLSRMYEIESAGCTTIRIPRDAALKTSAQFGDQSAMIGVENVQGLGNVQSQGNQPQPQ